MRTVSGARNRGLLTALGLVLTLAGVWLALLATGTASRLQGVDALVPAEGAAVGDLLGLVDQVLLPAGLALVVLVLLVSLWWLAHQVPTKGRPVDYRLQDDDDHGVVSIAPSVIATAVRAQCEELPDVTRATAELAGSARDPELLLDLTLAPDASVDRVLEQVYGTVVLDVAVALEVELAHVAVRLDVARAAPRDTRVAVQGTRPRAEETAAR